MFISAMTKSVKENPIKSSLGTLGLIIPVVGALFLVDARYAHAADVEKSNQQLQQYIQESTTNLRRQMLEDKLFELDMKKAQLPKQQLSPVDEALRNRYQQLINDMNTRHQNNNSNNQPNS